MARKKKIEGDDGQASVESTGKKLIAKKDWHILCGKWDKATDTMEFDFKIKAGDDVAALPEWALNCLKSENVI